MSMLIVHWSIDLGISVKKSVLHLQAWAAADIENLPAQTTFL